MISGYVELPYDHHNDGSCPIHKYYISTLLIGGLKKSNDVPVLTLLYKFSPEENKNQSSAAGNTMPKR